MGALGINLPGLIAQIINFLILLGLLYLLAYKPVMRMLHERSQRIKESVEQAEAIKEAMARTEQEVERRLEEAQKQGQALLAQASQMGERLKEEARQEARRQAEALIARAGVESQRERDEALEALRREFADLAILAAEKVIREALDKRAHKRLIDEVLEEARLD